MFFLKNTAHDVDEICTETSPLKLSVNTYDLPKEFLK